MTMRMVGAFVFPFSAFSSPVNATTAAAEAPTTSARLPPASSGDRLRDDCFRENHVYQGDHLAVVQSSTHYHGAKDCQLACHTHELCSHFTFVASNRKYGSHETACYLFQEPTSVLTAVSDIPDLLDGSTYISGPKRCAHFGEFTCHYDAKISAPSHPETVSDEVEFPATHITGMPHPIKCKKGFEGIVVLTCFTTGPYATVDKCEKARVYHCKRPEDKPTRRLMDELREQQIDGTFPATYSTQDAHDLVCKSGLEGRVWLQCSQHEVLVKKSFYSITHTCATPPPTVDHISSWLGLGGLALAVFIIMLSSLYSSVYKCRKKRKLNMKATE